ncbi:anti-sigma-I factor RsgI2-like [Eriocheir sinensis]|uniref:anti-sigma-I factor RsgI2-like n=1 Tax=Eriocheir sinensis TaxID=95602 RepID=UPI0021C68509|nr:anti-sigma-I factor RsgI2-like [Eriocheir sinensis]
MHVLVVMVKASPPSKYYLTRHDRRTGVRPYSGPYCPRIYIDAWRRKDTRHRKRDAEERKFDALLLGRSEDSEPQEKKRSSSNTKSWIRRLSREQEEARRHMSSRSILRESSRSSLQLTPPRDESISFSLVPLRQTPARASHTHLLSSRSAFPLPPTDSLPSFLSKSPSPPPRTPILSTLSSSSDLRGSSAPRLPSYSSLGHPSSRYKVLLESPFYSPYRLPISSPDQPLIRYRPLSPASYPKTSSPRLPCYRKPSAFRPTSYPKTSSPRLPSYRKPSASLPTSYPKTSSPRLPSYRKPSGSLLPTASRRPSLSRPSTAPKPSTSRPPTSPKLPESRPPVTSNPRSVSRPSTVPKPSSTFHLESSSSSSSEDSIFTSRLLSSFLRSSIPSDQAAREHSSFLRSSIPSHQAVSSPEDLHVSKSSRRSAHHHTSPDVSLPLVPLSPLRPRRSHSPASSLRRVRVRVEVHHIRSSQARKSPERNTRQQSNPEVYLPLVPLTPPRPRSLPSRSVPSKC